MNRCPNDLELRRYLEEALDAAGLEAVDAHVEGCAACRAALERLTAGGGDALRLLLDLERREGPLPATAATGSAGGESFCRCGPNGSPPQMAQGGRYELGEEVGRGGIGAVLRARDGVLNRDVAVKVLLEEHRGDADAERRLLAEAELTGGLQHPSIVPVYDKGRLPDGRPYFAMKLARGQTLARVLAERPDPAQDRPRLLAAFEQVAQAVGYAHSAGVLHRDLKPGNVMVGAFGEVQVMDWGLAKLLGDAAPGARHAGPAAIRCGAGTGGEDPTPVPRGPSGVEPSIQTRDGSVLGTPAYMAPEQARGEFSRLDARADVFALGGILCQILTGRPPFPGPGDEALCNARAGALSEAMAGLDGCGAHAELVRLAKACLSAEAAYRPRDGGAVARAMAAYLAGVQERLRAAERQRAAALAQAAEQKRRRRVQLALAAAVALLLLGGGTFAWWADRQATERRTERALAESKARFVAEQALADAEDGLRHDHPAKADTALQQAGRRLGDDAPADLRDHLVVLRRDREMLRDLDRIRDRRWTLTEWALDVTDAWNDYAAAFRSYLDVTGARRDYAAAFRSYGLAVGEGDPAALGRRIDSSPVGWRLVRGLDDWLLIEDDPARRAAIAAVLQAADPDELRSAFRLALAAGDGKRLRQLADGDLGRQPPAFVAMVGDVESIAPGRRRALLLEAWQRRPNDFVLAVELAMALDHRSQSTAEPRVAWYRTALALRPDSSAVWNNLGGALHEQGDPDGAISAYRAAIALDPKCAGPHNNLGLALYDKKDLDGAIAAYHDALALDPKRAEPHNNLGIVLGAKGDVDGAVAAFRKGSVLDPKYAPAHYNLGNALRDRGDLDGAVIAFRAALALDPKDAKAHNNLGLVLYDKRDLEGAIAAYHKALALDPKFAKAHTNLGNALHARGDLDGAIAAHRAALALDPKYGKAHNNLGLALRDKGDLVGAVAAHRSAIDCDPKDGLAHSNLGLALRAQGDLGGAIACYRAALALNPRLAPAHTHLGNALHDKGDLDAAVAAHRAAIDCDPKLATAHTHLGVALAAKKDLEGAIAAHRGALALDPKLSLAHCNLGNALAAQRRFPEAGAAYREAIRLKPDDHSAHDNLGIALAAQGRSEEAEASFREAIRLKPDAFRAHYNLGNILREQGRLPEAEAFFCETLRLKPDFPEAHCNLGQVLRRQGRFADALASLRRGDELGRKTSGWSYPSARWVRQCERLLELDGKLPGVLAGEARPADAAEQVELAALCRQYKRLYASSARLYLAAFAADPKLATDLRLQHRYNAACAAALAGCGRGEDARNRPEKAALTHRRQSLIWLRADLTAYAELAKRDDPAARQIVRQRLEHWQVDTDLAGVRAKDALDKLPEDERKQWHQLWADVAALLQQAAG
jgi:predicted ribosomally synthesized peptide with SipW-like signal peptide